MTCECGNPANTTVLDTDGRTEVPVCDECFEIIAPSREASAPDTRGSSLEVER